MVSVMSKITQSATIPPEQDNTLTFETALAELEAIVNQMESGELPLEQALAGYKRGTTLLQHCQKSLTDIEQQIRLLNEANQLQPYNITDE
jgi:exodeoxyribonuclease VII small subunit